MNTKDLKQISTSFFYWWYNETGNNTEQGFDEWIEKEKKKILDVMQRLDIGYGFRKKYISSETSINMELLTILLKELKHENKIQLLMIFSEENGLANGSGYCLTDKKYKELNLR